MPIGSFRIDKKMHIVFKLNIRFFEVNKSDFLRKI